jgi:hypothetical protein
VEHETLQVTPAFAGSFVTVAVTCKVFPGWTEPVEGVTTTATKPGVPRSVTAAKADLVGSANDVAVMVTLTFVAGGEAGGL